MKRIIKIAAITGIAFFATATAASASVTINDAGFGFVGKGDVQTALGMNNAALQKAVDAEMAKPGSALTFTSKQAVSQGVSQDATQSGSQDGSQAGVQSGTQSVTQSGTQTVSWDLSCTIDNKNKQFHREGSRDGVRAGTAVGTRTAERDATRTGTRDGVRTGTRSGVLSGVVNAEVNIENKKTGQWTGFNVKGLKNQSTIMDATPAWNEPTTFGDWSFGDDDWSFGNWSDGGAWSFGDYAFGAYTFGDVTWGGWQSEPGEAPGDCDRGNDKASNIVETVTYGDPVAGAITPGATTPGAVAPGGITESVDVHEGNVNYIDPVKNDGNPTYGAIALFVNGKPLPNTPVVAPAA